ncbi:zinc finger protein 60 [Hydra vulgaris]|uniref:zinc finger protein 60 n=1 Tax=Hydra vulgaris TaxID=6087 RepID=UPI0002B4D7E0|nr:zinc finger protein 60 [Hydra vulgaris]
MEISRSHGHRKRYCCYYCNTYFYQVDAWQRHNRKHTGVEIECEDCGDMLSDHFELKVHQQNCDASQIYTENTHMSFEEEFSSNKSLCSVKEKYVHDTPDSTSKQELSNNECIKSVKINPSKELVNKVDEKEAEQCYNPASNIEQFIGEHKVSREESYSEFMIGIDHTQHVDLPEQPGIDSTVLIKSEENKEVNSDIRQEDYTNNLDLNSFDISTVSPSSSNIDSQSINAENNEQNKKYQPYFCKNCGARFTRKDSVTRHLKKSTCSGKSLIVCDVCGKIFMETLDLHQHFKTEHKNMPFAPRLITQQLRPFIELSQNYYPKYLLSSGQQPKPPDPIYRSVAPSVHSLFHNPYASATSYVQQKESFHGRILTVMQKEFHDQDGAMAKNDLLLKRKNEFKRYGMEYFEDRSNHKYMKIDSEKNVDQYNQTPLINNTTGIRSINLSEYTSSAMNSKQYYDQHYMKKNDHNFSIKDNILRLHQCKFCGLEFPRFDYLLTHLRKHKEKSEIEKGDVEESPVANINEHEKSVLTSITNDSSSDDPSDNHAKQKSSLQKLPITTENINLETPNNSNQFSLQNKKLHQNNSNIQLTRSKTENSSEAITPGTDGKFRPFICENCGQRFTRKDSLVRHARKQTCFEEAFDLKCQECDKNFRYLKCLTQHQELVHGFKVNRLSNLSSDEDGSESERSEKSEENEKQLEPMGASMVELDSITRQEKYKSFHNETPNSVSQQHEETYSTQKFDEKSINQKSNGSEYSSSFGVSMLPRPFQCDYCGDRFAHRHSLKRHVRRHLGIGIPCHECGKLYRDQSEWRRHQRSIHNRHYEKSDVPNRISFNDGVDQGLIGIVTNSDSINKADDSSSDNSDIDTDMINAHKKNEPVYTDKYKVNTILQDNSAAKRFLEKPVVILNTDSKDEHSHHSQTGNDINSRKSVLDSYLFSADPVDTDKMNPPTCLT